MSVSRKICITIILMLKKKVLFLNERITQNMHHHNSNAELKM